MANSLQKRHPAAFKAKVALEVVKQTQVGRTSRIRFVSERLTERFMLPVPKTMPVMLGRSRVRTSH